MKDNDALRGDMSLEAARARMLSRREEIRARYYGAGWEKLDPDVPEVVGRNPSRLRLLWWRLTDWWLR